MGFDTRVQRDWAAFQEGVITLSEWGELYRHYDPVDQEEARRLMILDKSKYESTSQSVMLEDGTIHVFPEKQEKPFEPIHTLRWVVQTGEDDYSIGRDISEDDVVKLIEADIKMDLDSDLTLQQRGAKWLTRITNAISQIVREADDDG